MSEVSKIEVDGANYDIKDETARANAKTNADAISQLNTDLTDIGKNLGGIKICITGSYTDFNDAVDGGIYYLANTARDNEPNSSYHNGYLIVLSSGSSVSDYKLQIFFAATSARMWFRRKTSVWGAWVFVQTETVS